FSISARLHRISQGGRVICNVDRASDGLNELRGISSPKPPRSLQSHTTMSFHAPVSLETEPATPLHRQLFGHPRPLYTLFFAELWERFSYYGMRALLTLFMTVPVASAGLGFTDAKASLIYGTYTMSVYMMSIP